MRLVRTANGPAGKAVVAEDREAGQRLAVEAPRGVGGRWLVVSLEPGQTTGWHAVHCEVYVWVAAGEVELALDGGERVALGAGDAVVEGDNTLHSWTNTGSGPATLSAFELDLP